MLQGSSGDYDRDLPRNSRWLDPYNVLQTNLQEIDVLMDVDAAADAAVDYGADTWLLNAGGIESFYPTDLPFQTRNPLLATRPSGDLFGDAVAAAKRRDLKIIARLDMSKVSTRIANEHPEWLFRSADGKPQVYNTLFSVCPSAEYYQSRTFDVLDEIIDRYDIDAVFFNWFNFNERDYDEVMHGPCHCDSCKTGFDRFSGGKELPADMKAETFGLWRQYVSATLGDLTARIANHVNAKERDIGVILRAGAPIVYLEANNAFRAMPGTELWPHATAEAVSAHISSRPESSVMVNCVAFIDSTYRMGSEQPEHFAQYVLQTMARGGNPSAYYMGAPGRLPMAWSISSGREVMRFRSSHTDLYRALRPAANIGLVRPDIASSAPNHWDALEEFRGVYLSLLEAHLPFDVIPIDQLGKLGANGGLDRYSLMILPDVGTLGRAAAAVDAFVHRGGNLIATGSSGLSRDGAIELQSSPARRTPLVVLSGTELRSTFVTDAAQPRMGEYHYEAPVLPVYGRYLPFDWKPEAEEVGFLLPQAPFAPPELAYGHTGSAHPDYVRGRYGGGAVTCIPWTIGRTYREFSKTDVRDHLLGIVRSLVIPDITGDLHENVELITGRSGHSTVIHVLNHTGARRRSYGPLVPVTGGWLRLTGRGHEKAVVETLVAGIELESRTLDDDLVIDLPPLELFEVVTVTPRS